MPSSRVPTVPCITGNWVRTDRMPVPRSAESALTAKAVRSVRAGTRPVSIASWKQRSVARPMTSADSPRREEDARPNRGRKGVAPRRISPMNLGGGSATGTGYNTTRRILHRVIPDCFRGSVMASAANSAAAARSSDDGAAMAALPDGEGGSRDENADEVAKHGLHARCPYCDRGPYARYTNLAAHVRVHHPGQKPPQRFKFACLCHGRLFGHRWLRDQHERDSARVVCPHCGREMARSNLRRHVHRCRYRLGGPAHRPHQCTECGLTFMTKRGATATGPLACSSSQTHRSDPTRCSSPQGPHRHKTMIPDLYGAFCGGTPRSTAMSSCVDCRTETPQNA
jgi:hypothetical protein